MKEIIELKLHPKYFGDVMNEIKTFEIRKNDRHYQVGCELVLEEYSPEGGYTGRKLNRVITYMSDYEQKEGFVVLGIVPI